MLQGTKEGERIKKIVSDGGLVPFELTVQILIKAMIASPSEVSYDERMISMLIPNNIRI